MQGQGKRCESLPQLVLQSYVFFTRPGAVRLAVYDLLGREVAVLAEGTRPAGAHTAPAHAAYYAAPPAGYAAVAPAEPATVTESPAATPPAR